MPRQARFIVPDVALHVIQRGHNRNATFRQDTDCMVYLATLAELLKTKACALHAYCLMTNHVHLLLTPATEYACAALMRNPGATIRAVLQPALRPQPWPMARALLLLPTRFRGIRDRVPSLHRAQSRARRDGAVRRVLPLVDLP